MSAAWSPLPTGEFTGIDWGAPGAIDGQDPYLAWAEADRFAGYRVKPQGKPPTWLPIVIELTPGASVPALVQASNVKWLQIPRVYLNLPTLRFCTAHVKRRFFEKLRSDAALRRLILRALPQARIIHLLVDRVDVGPDGADVRLKVEGLASLARDLRAPPDEPAMAAA